MTLALPLRGVGIGAGYFSQIQYEAWKRVEGASLLAVADLDEARARATATRHDVPRHYVDFLRMLDEERPDFVDVVTPPDTHLELCAEAAERGIHVICQKPLAPTYEEAEEIVRVTEAAGVRFMVHENWRWQPWYREIKKLLEDGVLGEPFTACFTMRTGDGWPEDAYLARQPYFRDYPRLLIYETGVHFIDTFRFLFGEVATVYARLRRLNPAIRGEDAGYLLFEFEEGASAVLDANRYNEPETEDDPRYTFGTMRIDGSQGHLRLGTDGSIVIKPLGRKAYEHAYDHRDRGLGGDSCFFLQSHFVAAMSGDFPFESGGRDYLKTLRVVEGCYESNAASRIIDLREAAYADDANEVMSGRPDSG